MFRKRQYNPTGPEDFKHVSLPTDPEFARVNARNLNAIRHLLRGANIAMLGYDPNALPEKPIVAAQHDADLTADINQMSTEIETYLAGQVAQSQHNTVSSERPQQP